MITCYLKYVIDPEGANNVAFAMFSFPSLAAYEDYRKRMAADPECQEVFEMEKRNRSILSYERSFLRPVLEP
ncbi:NIPSNAP family protein [Mesorhizobium sp. M1342]|uniref:NIPSNAP family protein n=1 Tax=Mesorhizobium sp. M1342 TaxID=2957088 RepID=UPI00333C97A9